MAGRRAPWPYCYSIRIRSGPSMRPSLFALLLAVAGSAVLAGHRPAAAQSAPGASASADPFLWLEDVDGKRAMDWVNTENARSLKVLESDPRYSPLHADALALAQAKDRIPQPEFLSGQVYNFWQYADHVRGLWRATSVGDYAQPEPEWRTVLDLDQLAKTENANWVFKGAACERPHERL